VPAPPSQNALYFGGLLETIEEAGVDGTDLCRACGIERARLGDPEARIGRPEVLRFWEEAGRRLGVPNPGLYLGERVRPRARNVAVYAMMSSPTLREGLERIIRYQRLLGDFSRLTVKDEGARSFVRIDSRSPEQPLTRDEAEFTSVLLLRYCRWVTDRDLVPLEARLGRREPADPSDYERVFGCPVRFGAAEEGLLLAAEDLALPSLHASEEMAREHERLADRHLSEIEDSSVGGRLRRLLATELEVGSLDLRAAAKRLSMSPRTLQRRLAAEETTYGRVLDEVRRDLALARLRSPDASIGEVAYLTGFSELSTFYRAFKRWTGQTPSEYRSSSRSER
jgi:AraC-like DNA-binding protein